MEEIASDFDFKGHHSFIKDDHVFKAAANNALGVAEEYHLFADSRKLNLGSNFATDSIGNQGKVGPSSD
jgi:hypothetical protein